MTLMAEIGIISSCEVMYTYRVMQITMLLAMGITTQKVALAMTGWPCITGPFKRTAQNTCTIHSSIKLLEYSTGQLQGLDGTIQQLHILIDNHKIISH